MTACLNRVHGYEQKSIMTLYLFTVLFTFKLTFKGFKFGPNLHNQDDVIWHSCYYKKLSSSYDLSAYKILTKLEQWLLRYETKENACCAHAQCECLARFMTEYLDRVLWYQQKSTMSLYLLNVIFTFKIAVKDFKCGRGKSKFVFKKKEKIMVNYLKYNHFYMSSIQIFIAKGEKEKEKEK